MVLNTLQSTAMEFYLHCRSG